MSYIRFSYRTSVLQYFRKLNLISLYANIIKDGKAGNKTEYCRPVVTGMQLGIGSGD